MGRGKGRGPAQAADRDASQNSIALLALISILNNAMLKLIKQTARYNVHIVPDGDAGFSHSLHASNALKSFRRLLLKSDQQCLVGEKDKFLSVLRLPSLS